MICKQVFFEGRVQGVGFRYTVRSLVRGFEVTGWVKNLVDGRVELRAQGEPAEVRAFLETVRTSELESYIRKVDERDVPVEPALRGFEITW